MEQLRAVPAWVTLTGKAIEPENPLVRSIYDGTPHPCICVTGVYPRKRQIERLATRFKLDSKAVDSQTQLIDFLLERQVVADPEDAETEWTPVDDELMRDVLRVSEGFTEVIREEFFNSAITMPLPCPAEAWGREISHPELKKVYQARYRAGQTEDLPPGRADVLLFRYIDFGVESGKDYRYRVRLELIQPEAAPRPGTVRSIPTPWSEPTAAVSVSTEPAAAARQQNS